MHLHQRKKKKYCFLLLGKIMRACESALLLGGLTLVFYTVIPPQHQLFAWLIILPS